jgi:hypothetical protein
VNTIPTIFSENVPPYTAVGGKERYASTGLSAVILNRNGRYSRRTYLKELEKTGFDYVISIESSPERYDLEDLCGRFPFVRFILPKTEITIGEKINLAALETESPLFFVLWNDLKIIAGGTARRMAERLSHCPEEIKGDEKRSRFKRLCTFPMMLNSRYETLPSIITPVSLGKKIKTILLEPQSEGLPSLYPHDGVGIYDRERFISLGGFDSSIRNAHWQSMDFGFRAWLWGEEIRLTQATKLSYDRQMPIEDNTGGESYRRFYLKNIAPVFRRDYAHLPLRRFLSFLFRSGEDPFAAWEDFSESRRWVKTNRYRWRTGINKVIKNWGQEASTSQELAPAHPDSDKIIEQED